MLSRALSLAAAILVARTLGKVVYGELGIIQSTVGMFGTLAGFGMGTTSSKFVAEFRDKDPQRAGRIIALSSVVSWAISIGLGAVLALLAPALCLHTLAAPHLAPGLRDSAALLILSGINGAQLGVLAGLEAFKTIARVSVLTGLLSFPLIVGGALLFGLTGVIGGMAAAQTSGCLLNLRALRREARRYRIPLSYSSCVSELPILWRFSVPAVLAELLISSINWCAAAMLVRQPNGYSEMGSFSAANQWFNMLMWLPFMLNSVMLPVLSERLGANDKGNVAGLLKLTMKMNAAIVLPCVVVGSLLSPYIMMSYGRGFAAAWPTLVAVLVTAGLLSVELPVGQLIAASGRMWLGFSSNIGWSLVFLTATAVLLRLEWGSLGLAAGRLAAYGAHTVFSISYAVFFARSPRATETSTPALSLRAFR
ncbi:MAG: oligosaccharide flippase family protein [Acidobacteriia bacterium]|nr:oligosaccharide flippase family protein [Terriglobia bacterium]